MASLIMIDSANVLLGIVVFATQVGAANVAHPCGRPISCVADTRKMGGGLSHLVKASNLSQQIGPFKVMAVLVAFTLTF